FLCLVASGLISICHPFWHRTGRRLYDHSSDGGGIVWGERTRKIAGHNPDSRWSHGGSNPNDYWEDGGRFRQLYHRVFNLNRSSSGRGSRGSVVAAKKDSANL